MLSTDLNSTTRPYLPGKLELIQKHLKFLSMGDKKSEIQANQVRSEAQLHIYKKRITAQLKTAPTSLFSPNFFLSSQLCYTWQRFVFCLLLLISCQ